MASKKSGSVRKNGKKTTAPGAPSPVDAWILAARPKTLAAASSPVIVALALAYRDIIEGRARTACFLMAPALCCLAFAVLAQVAANFINDYADYKKGTDTEKRKGPARAVASGWITPRAMLIGTFVALGAACLFGLATLPFAGALGWGRLVARGAASSGVYRTRRRLGNRVFRDRRGLFYLRGSDGTHNAGRGSDGDGDRVCRRQHFGREQLPRPRRGSRREEIYVDRDLWGTLRALFLPRERRDCRRASGDGLRATRPVERRRSRRAGRLFRAAPLGVADAFSNSRRARTCSRFSDEFAKSADTERYAGDRRRLMTTSTKAARTVG